MKRKKVNLEKFLALLSVVFLLSSLILNFMGVTRYVFTAILFWVLFYFWVGVGYCKQNPKDRNITLILFAMVLLVLSQFVTQKIGSNNDWSRMGTMRSLVHNNTFETGFKIGQDKIRINGKFYSSKPPLLSFLGAGVYNVVLGVAGFGGQNVKRPSQLYFWITLFLITVPSSLGAVMFYKLLRFTKIKEYYRFLLVFALVFGTLLFSYGGTVNNHTVAAAALLAGFYFLLLTKFRPLEQTKAAIACGFFFALAATFDLTGFIWLVLFAGYFLFYRKYRLCGWYILGAALPLIFHLSLTYHITGGLLPPQIAHPEFFQYPGSYWSKGFANQNLDPWPAYLMNITIGHHGVFVYTPLFLFSILGLIFQLRNRKQKFWSEGVVISLGIFFLLLIFLFVNSRNYSGVNYGFRWFIPVIPLLFFFTSFIFLDEFTVDSKYLWIYKLLLLLFFIVLAYSIYVAYVGTSHAWDRYPPPFYFKLT